MNTRFLVYTILAVASLASFNAAAADLKEVYERAITSDPLIREADANRLAARESKPQAIAAVPKPWPLSSCVGFPLAASKIVMGPLTAAAARYFPSGDQVRPMVWSATAAVHAVRSLFSGLPKMFRRGMGTTPPD